MARVTVEDCIQRVPNRFELVMMAGQRAREISAGSSLTIDRDNDKNPVVALREIADETVDLAVLRNELIRGHQKVVEVDEPEEDIIELMAGEQGWVAQHEAGAGGDAIADESPEDDLQELDESAQPFEDEDVGDVGSLGIEEEE